MAPPLARRGKAIQTGSWRWRDDIRYIYSTFPIAEREEAAKYGRYRSRDPRFAWINALIAGQPGADVDG